MIRRRLLIMWGCHRAHGSEPLKLCEWTAKAQKERERLGWLCAAYLDGDDPKGLRMLWTNTMARAEGADPHQPYNALWAATQRVVQDEKEAGRE